jgi:hypothetical protein
VSPEWVIFGFGLAEKASDGWAGFRIKTGGFVILLPSFFEKVSESTNL